MRMTKPGKTKSQIFRGHCNQCTAEFEATAEELKGKIQYDHDPRESGQRYSIATCTYCHKGTVHLWEQK